MPLKLFMLVFGLVEVCIAPNTQPKNAEDNIVRGPKLPSDTFEEELKNTSIDEYIIPAAERRSDDVYLIDAVTGEEITMKEFLQKSYNLAAQLQALGCDKDTVVGIMSENRLEYPVVIFGTILTGAPITCYNPAFTINELKQFFKVANPAVIFCSSENCVKLRRVAPSTCKVIEFNESGSLEFVPKESLKPFVRVKNRPDDIACILYSCGTTSLAKGVALTHRNLLFVLKLDAANLLIERVGKKIVALISFYRISAFEAVLAAVPKNETVIIIPKADNSLYLSVIAENQVIILRPKQLPQRVKHFTLAPATIPFLMKNADVDKHNLSEVEFLTLGAAPIKAKTERALKKKFPHVKYIQQLYGLTEATMFTTVKRSDSKKAGTSGTVIPGIQVKVMNTQTGKILDKNKLGEIYVKGPTVMKGYFRNKAATDRAIDKDGWLRTGDIGYYDKDGDFFVLDRATDFIKREGTQIPPSELEALLLTHPLIDDAAVIGIPDQQAGELPRAYVVKRPGANVTEDEIVRYVAGKVPPKMDLAGGVEFIPVIPKNAIGNILRRELRDLWNLTVELKSKTKSKL